MLAPAQQLSPRHPLRHQCRWMVGTAAETEKPVAPLLRREGKAKPRGGLRGPHPALLSPETLGADPAVRRSEGPTGAHVVGRLDTYRSLEQRILEGKALAHELTCVMRPGKEVKRGQDGAGARREALSAPWINRAAGSQARWHCGAFRAGSLQHGVPVAGTSVLEAYWRGSNPRGCSLLCWAGDGSSLGAAGWGCPSSSHSCTLFPQVPGYAGAGQLWGSASTLHRVLEECASLLTTFWSTVLPVSPAQHQGKVSTVLGARMGLGARRSRPSSRPRSRLCRVRSRRCVPSSVRRTMPCRARPSGSAAWPGSRTAWSSSSSASVGGTAKLAPFLLYGAALWHGDLTDPVPFSLAVTRTHGVLRKARTNLEVSLPWPPGQSGVPSPWGRAWMWDSWLSAPSASLSHKSPITLLAS